MRSARTLDDLPSPLPYPFRERVIGKTANAQVDAAFQRAQLSGKRVLIDFGGNWCGWCRMLEAVMTLPEVKPFVEGHFEVVHVYASSDKGKSDRNLQLLRRFGLCFDLQTPWWHLHEAAQLARTYPDTQIILNHAGLPADRSSQGLEGWKREMATLAQCPNVAVKISGIGVPGQVWTAAANRSIVLGVIDLFGTGRAMFASNFPVDSLCATFSQIFDGFREIGQAKGYLKINGEWRDHLLTSALLEDVLSSPAMRGAKPVIDGDFQRLLDRIV